MSYNQLIVDKIIELLFESERVLTQMNFADIANKITLFSSKQCSKERILSYYIKMHANNDDKVSNALQQYPQQQCSPDMFVNKVQRDLQIIALQLWEVELLFLVYYVSNYILKYFATSNADDKFQQIISSWRLFMNYSLTQEGQKYDFDRIRPQSTIQSRYLIFQKRKIEITTCNKRTAMTKINAVEDVQGRSTNSLNKLRQF
ncbi:Hypothetical_protein [Hexamita inflata]|uniref:Hypothetical_protein n=1 Tax=Hexamita inflata TaxID=28002 RepID=A0AA86PVR6_9EUKA|nr:Hypothetical protein HINF_LOCUS18175 [Hexamita inflata]CAI9946861.1 Hypothetical protein HINF_LOCUS34506 [Hexamita inflata]